MPLKTAEDIEAAVQYFNDTIQWACCNTTPEQTNPLKTKECTLLIKQKSWTNADYADVGTNSIHQGKNVCSTQQPANSNNSSTTTEITASKPSSKASHLRHSPTIPYGKRSKKQNITKSSPPLRTTQGTWSRSDIEKANTFAEHLANVFEPHRSENYRVEEETLIHYLETPYQLDPPLSRLLRSEVHAVVKNLNPKKSPEYDIITVKILQELPVVGI
jgi:hypothetical protein